MNNTTVASDETRRPFEYFGHIMYIVEGSWMVVTNTLIVLTLMCHRSMQKHQMHTVVALAVSDGLYGVGILSGGVRRLLLVAMHTDRMQMSAWQCLSQFPTTFYIVGSQMTALSMVLISVDRYIVVTHTFWYLKIDRKRHFRITIMMVVGFGMLTGALAWTSTYAGWGDDTHAVRWSALCLSTWAVPGWYATGYTAFVTICGYLSIVIYIMVLVGYRQYARSSIVQDGDSNLTAIKMQVERRLTVTMALVTLVTLVFHSIPYTTVILTTLLKLKANYWVGLLNPFLWCMVCVNSLVNIFIYLKRHRDIRNAMGDVLCCRFRADSSYINSQANSLSLKRPYPHEV